MTTPNSPTAQTATSAPEIDIEYFKLTLKEYLKVTEEMKSLQKALKQRRDRLADLDVTLLALITKNNLAQVELQGAYVGQELTALKQQRIKGPSANSILDIIKEKLSGNPDLLNDITNTIEGLKETVEIEKLKIGKISKPATTTHKIVKPKAIKPKAIAIESDESTALLLGAATTN